MAIDRSRASKSRCRPARVKNLRSPMAIMRKRRDGWARGTTSTRKTLEAVLMTTSRPRPKAKRRRASTPE